MTDTQCRTGTLENPIIVNGAGDEQYAGCTGFPADSHTVNWLTVSLCNAIEWRVLYLRAER